MATQIWGGGGGPPAYAVVKVNSDGTADVIAGVQDIGTGTKTGLAQVAAEELGFSVDKVRVSIGQTDQAPYGPVSAGSMTMSSAGPAVRAAAMDARNQLLDIAAQLSNVPRESLELKDNHIIRGGTSQARRSVSELMQPMGDVMVIGRGSRSPNPSDYVIRTFGVQIAEVEVDEELGHVRVLRVVAVHDFGRVINPVTARSQIEGGIIQGVGYSLMEEQVTDGRFGGALNANLEEYLIPTAQDTPAIETYFIDQVDPHSNNLGAKGVGEPPLIPTAPAIANAVYQATGIRLTSLPISPEQLLRRKVAP